MLMVVLNLNLFSISWEHVSIILFIISFLAWDILNKMMLLLLGLHIVWVMWVHFFIIFFIIFLRGGVGVGMSLRLNLAKSTVSIEVSHFVGNVMLWLGILHLLCLLLLLVIDDLF